MLPKLKTNLQDHYRGVLLAVTVAAAATFLSEHYGAPVMLFALLLGMAFHFMACEDECSPGIEFCAKTILRLGVGLLGLRLSITEIESVGLTAVVALAGFVFATIMFSIVLCYIFGRRTVFGVLAGGAVAICGASSALAITAVMPQKANREQDVLFVVIGVTALSTIAMILYPIIFALLGLSDVESGFLVGATIHDVAQVVGAGYSISDEAGVIATFVKMVRVALLPVVMIAIITSFRGSRRDGVMLPWFLIMFVALAVMGNVGIIPEGVIGAVNTFSRWCLVIAISALGVKTSLGMLAKVDKSYSAILLANTIFLLLVALIFVLLEGL